MIVNNAIERSLSRKIGSGANFHSIKIKMRSATTPRIRRVMTSGEEPRK